MNEDSQEVELQHEVTQAAEEPTQSTQAETPPWEQKEPEKPAPQQTNNTDPEEHLKKARGGFQRRIDELVREREHERAEKQRLLDIMARQQQPQQERQQPAAKGNEEPPKLNDFDDYEKYLSAKFRYEAKQAYAEQKRLDEENATKAQHQRQVHEQHQKLIEKQSALRKMTEAAEKKYPDFYDKVFNQPDLPITPIIGEAILESEMGQDVAYYLGTHPAEAERLAKLSPTAALREFGKIEAALSKQQSSAPPPINPLNAKKGGDDSKIGPKEDYETFLRKRNKQLGRT